MSNKNGHWYTDKNGQHYFVEDGQSPKEGWEASKRRKMISGGKYKISEDGNEYKDVTEDEYNKYEADETGFDENNEDDFGFDEDNNDGDNWGLKDYQLEEIEKSLAPNAEMSMSKALDIIGKETEDLVKEGYDLDDAYAMARDNFIDTYSINGENPEENKEIKKYKSVNSDDVYSEDYIRDQIKGMDRTEAFSTMTRLGIDEDDAKEIWVNELNDRGMNEITKEELDKMNGSQNSVMRDAEKLRNDPTIPMKEQWSDAYYNEVKEAMNSSELKVEDYKGYKIINDKDGITVTYNGQPIGSDYDSMADAKADIRNHMKKNGSQDKEKSAFEMAREMHIPLDDLEGSNEEKIREMYKEYKKDFRDDYPNQDKMEEADFKNQFPEYEKGKGGYQYYKYGSNRGYTLHDAEGTTVGFYDLNNNTLYSVDEAKNVKKNGLQSNELSEADRKWNDYKEKGKSTWNQTLNKGDKVTFKDRQGKDVEAYIDGFYYKGEVVDKDTYEEGKDNMWHDFRGLHLVDKDGREIGNINANQITSHQREAAKNKAKMTPDVGSRLNKGSEYITRKGNKIKIDDIDIQMGLDGPSISVKYSYETKDGRKGQSDASYRDIYNMLMEK